MISIYEIWIFLMALNITAVDALILYFCQEFVKWEQDLSETL